MVVLDTFGDALSLLRRHPTLVVYLFVTGVVSNALGSGEYLDLPDGGTLLLSLLSLVVGPAITVGVIGLVNDAAENARVSVGAFTASVLQNYFSALAAGLIIVLVTVIVVIVGFIAAMIPLVSIVVVFAFIVLIIAAAITLQFVDLAIVVDDAGAVDGIERSYEVAIANLGAVIGYVLFELLFVLLITAPFLVLWFDDGFTTATPTVQPTPALVGALVVAALGSTVLQTYRVTFYRALSNRT